MDEQEKIAEQCKVTNIIKDALTKNSYSWRLDVKEDLWIRINTEWKLLMPFTWHNDK